MSSEPESNGRAELYRSVGEAIHLAQTLELYASVIVTIIGDRFGEPLDVEGLLLPDYRDTLGQLIGRMKQMMTIDAVGTNVLANALDSRNYVTHHFFNRNAHAFSAEEPLASARADLKAHKFALVAGTALLQSWSDALRHRFGIDGRPILVKQDSRKIAADSRSPTLHDLASRRLASNES